MKNPQDMGVFGGRSSTTRGGAGGWLPLAVMTMGNDEPGRKAASRRGPLLLNHTICSIAVGFREPRRLEHLTELTKVGNARVVYAENQ